MELIRPQWPAPSHIIAGVTARNFTQHENENPGYSLPPYQHFNLASHVGDNKEAVQSNRALLDRYCQSLNNESSDLLHWHWLEQIHSTRIVEVRSENDNPEFSLPADAAWTKTPRQVCTVLTADCLPILLCDHRGEKVAAVHAGWRGLLNGIVDNSVSAICAAGGGSTAIRENQLYAWLGPAIGPRRFEVGAEIRTAFLKKLGRNNSFSQCDQAFEACSAANHTSQINRAEQKYLADIYQLATIVLQQCGVRHIYGGGFCTVSEPERFFSYRRDGATGRMASFIYIAR